MKRLLCTLTTIALFALAGLSQSVVFTSSNLPVIVINTNGQAIVDDPKITADMGIIFNASNARNNITDPFNHYNGKIGNEESRNVDGYRLSSYFNKDRNSKNSKIIAGPVWDYDLAFRNANYCNGSNRDG
jgi:hypothetical protein